MTLFHHLPGDEHDAVQAELVDAVQRDPFDLAVIGVRLLGGGVAYDLHAPEVEALHARLAAAWAPWLTRQDRQPVRPHVTVQNKVPPAQARELHARLSAAFVPAVVRAEGLALWRYLGGPWEPVSRNAFVGGPPD